MGHTNARRYPVLSLAAEHLVIGHLMRRNILAYKAPPCNEGYDLICIHPDPRKSAEQIRVQVKCRYQTDSDRAFPIREESFDAFDYVVLVFLNNGLYYSRKPVLEGRCEPEFYTLPKDFLRAHHKKTRSGFDRVLTDGVDMAVYKNEAGFEIIAQDLGIPYPGLEDKTQGQIRVETDIQSLRQ